MRSSTHEPLSREQLEKKRRQRRTARASTTYRNFLKVVGASLLLPLDRAEQVVSSVLSTLEQTLPQDEMAHLASQLPSKLRELLASGEWHEPLPSGRVGAPEFLVTVARDLNVGPDEAEHYVRGVFRALTATVSPGEIEDVVHVLRRDLRELWPRSERDR
jgi:uncharacterized protein (DUF2267 family)